MSKLHHIFHQQQDTTMLAIVACSQAAIQQPPNYVLQSGLVSSKHQAEVALSTVQCRPFLFTSTYDTPSCAILSCKTTP